MSAITAHWTRSSADATAVAEGCYFDLAAAERVRTFFAKYLRHGKGRWKGEAFDLLPWQWEDVIAPLYGWKRPDGTRRYHKGGIWIAKKNGKSALGSGLSLYHLLADGEKGPEVYNAAADRAQAGIVFNEALNMIRASPGLSDILDPKPSRKLVEYPAQNGVYQALSADVKTKEGLNWSFILFDELHAQPNRLMFDTLRYGGAARLQPLFLTLSTAGVYDPTSIGWEEYQRAKRRTAEDTSFFAHIAEADADDDIESPETWKKANPSLGSTVLAADMAVEAREARESPTKENSFRRYRLNQWVQQEVRWLGVERWNACAAVPKPPATRPVYAGLDLSATTDLTAAVFLTPDDDGTYDVFPHFWVPEEACKRRERSNRQRLDAWCNAGFITRTPGYAVNYAKVRADLNALRATYRVKELAADRWNATQLLGELEGDGWEVVAYGQGFRDMNAPCKELEALLLGGRIRHGGNPVLAWNFANLAMETDAAGNLKPSKKRATEKIDGIVALLMALGRAMLRPQVASVYESRGILRL